ncbi:MAG: D-glycero-beta-D-manno-heptose-7-phosphate kinase [bacterium]|nr:D-glycero-beta-D-manno-heptose-7-phosphate kinase [bacterium]
MISKEELLADIFQCKNQKVLVVGDIMLDEYHWCDVGRISPEAPVPVCRVGDTTIVPGGAANVANNIKALGSIPYLAGVLGRDSSGDKLVRKLKESGIDTHCIIQDDEKPTILKSRIVAHQQHVVRVDREDSSPISRRLKNRLFEKIEKYLPEIDVILISDYLKGTLPDSFVKKIIAEADNRNIQVVVDPKGDHYMKYKGSFILTPNFHEFETVVKKRMLKEEGIITEGVRLIKKLKLERLLVTRSEKGMSIITKDGEKKDIPTKAKEVYDITGAGDTVISVLSIALAAGWTAEKAAYLANYAAGVVVGKIGTSTTTLEEIRKAIEKY